MATGTNGIATVADVLSISGVKVTGNYTPSQCVKYSDIKKVPTIPLTTMNIELDLGEFIGWRDGDYMELNCSLYQNDSTNGYIFSVDLFVNEQNYLDDYTVEIPLPVVTQYPYCMELEWLEGYIAGGQVDVIDVIINGSTITLDQFTEGSSRVIDLSDYQILSTLDNGAAIGILKPLNITINA